MEKGFFEYKGVEYPYMSTTLSVDGVEEEFVLATDALWCVMESDWESDDEDALRLDNEIFYYLSDEEFSSINSEEELNNWILSFLKEG